MNIDGNLNSNNADIADHFNSHYSTLAKKLVEKLPPAPKWFGKKETANYYEGKNLQNNNFTFQTVDQFKISKILNNLNDLKFPGFDNIPGRFLRDGDEILSRKIAAIFNLSVLLSKFSNQCKRQKLNQFLRKVPN